MDQNHEEVTGTTTETPAREERSASRKWLVFTLLMLLAAGVATSSALAGSVDPAAIGSYYMEAAKSAVGANAEEGKACSSKDKEGKACSSKDKAAKAEGSACSSKDKEAKAEDAACSSKDKEAKAEGKECCSSKKKDGETAKSEESKEEAVQVSKAE
jgi:hypothetical protein